MPRRSLSDSSSTSSDFLYGDSPSGSIIDLSIRPSEITDERNETSQYYAVAANVRVRAKDSVIPPLNQLFSPAPRGRGGYYQHPIKANKDKLWFDFYKNRSIFLFNNLDDAKRYCLSNKDLTDQTYKIINPIFHVEIHSQPVPTTLTVCTPPNYTLEETELLSCHQIDNIYPAMVQCLEVVIIDPRSHEIQETISYENKGGRSLDFWRDKWNAASGDDFDKAKALLAQYAGKNGLSLFFSGHWRTHHAPAVQATLKAFDENDTHLGFHGEPAESITRLFSELKAQLDENKPLKASGDLSRILWVIEEKTKVSFDAAEERATRPLL